MQPRMSLTSATSRGVVIDLIRSQGPISRVELAASTGLTQATMSNIVKQLLLDGLVLEIGRGESTGGKPRVLLDINPTARFAVGIQLGAETVTYVVSNLAGALVGRTRTLGAGAMRPQEATDAIAWRIDALLTGLGIEHSRVVGIGVVAPGPLDLNAGTILAPPTLETWAHFPLRERLQSATGLPVVLDNDATAAAIGEFWTGAIADSTAHCSVYMGAGLGAGIVLGGTVFRGASSNGGEIGQMWMTSNGAVGQLATVEQLVAPQAVSTRARAALAAGRSASFALKPHADAFEDFLVIATAAVHGDDLAVALITESADYLATAVLSLANVLDLDSVTLAGPAFATAGTFYIERIAARLEANFFARKVHGVRVRLSNHVSDAAAVGAAALVLQQELAPRTFGLGPAGRIPIPVTGG